MIHWRVCRLANSLGAGAAAWDELNERLFHRHPMLDSRFVNGLLKNFGNGSEHLCTLTVNDAPEAMCILQRRSFGTWSTFLPSQAQISPALIQNPVALKALMRQLPGFVVKLDVLCYDPALGNLASGDYATANRMDHALTMHISLEGGFDHYWAGRSKNLVQNMGRYERRMAADHVARKLVCISDPAEIAAAVARYAALESRGWKGNAGTALGGDNPQNRFYADLMTDFARTGNATVYELWFDDQLAASRLLITSGDMVVTLKTTYEESYGKYAPGRLLLRETIQALFTTCPGKVLEFYTDANTDQRAWSCGHRWISHWSFYRSSFSINFFSIVSALRLAFTRRAPPYAILPASDRVEVFQHADQLPRDVQALFDDAEKDEFQLGMSWYQNFINSVHPDQTDVRIYVLRRDGRAIVALPIVARKTWSGWRVESLSNYYTSLYAPPAVLEMKYRDLALLLGPVLRAYAPVISLCFTPLDPESRSYSRLRNALQANGLACFSFFCFGNWHLPVENDWSSYLKSRTGQLRSTLKRMSKRFSAEGGTLELLGGADADRGLRAFERVYASSWKKPEPYPAFVPGLVRTCAERGLLRLGIAWLKGIPIAAQLWIVVNKKACIYKMAYDEQYKSFASGTLLTAMLMKHVIELDQVVDVDYLTGDDPYKQAWMSRRRERWGIIAYNPRTLGGIAALVKEILGRALKPFIVRFRRSLARLEK